MPLPCCRRRWPSLCPAPCPGIPPSPHALKQNPPSCPPDPLCRAAAGCCTTMVWSTRSTWWARGWTPTAAPSGRRRCGSWCGQASGCSGCSGATAAAVALCAHASVPRCRRLLWRQAAVTGARSFAWLLGYSRAQLTPPLCLQIPPGVLCWGGWRSARCSKWGPWAPCRCLLWSGAWLRWGSGRGRCWMQWRQRPWRWAPGWMHRCVRVWAAQPVAGWLPARWASTVSVLLVGTGPGIGACRKARRTAAQQLT